MAQDRRDATSKWLEAGLRENISTTFVGMGTLDSSGLVGLQPAALSQDTGAKENRKGDASDTAKSSSVSQHGRKKRSGILTGHRQLRCPFQAVYPLLLDCFKPGLSRNRTGGSKNLWHLKQHIYERHTISRRCQSCWLRFRTKAKAEQHHILTECEQNPRPHSEVFIGSDQEGAIEEAFRSSSSVETLWMSLLQMVPCMEGFDFSSDALKSPYYDTAHGGGSSQALSLYNELQGWDFDSVMDQPWPRSQSFTALPRDTTISAQQTTQDHANQPSLLGLQFTVPADTYLPQLDENPAFLDIPSGSTADQQAITSGAALPDENSEPGVASHSDYLQSINDRLRRRILQLEMDHANLRESTRANREALKRGQELLEVVRADPDMPAHVRTQLTDVAVVLASTVAKMMI